MTIPRVKLSDLEEDGQIFLCITDQNVEQPSETRLLVRKSLIRCDASDLFAVNSSNFPKNMTDEATPIPSKGLSSTHILRSTLPTEDATDTDNFPLLGREIITNGPKWKGRTIKVLGEAKYIEGYWEWAEDIISRFEQTLKDSAIYDAVYSSLYSYVKEPCAFRSFLEGWCSKTNTLHTTFGELSISLWDLHHLSGLAIVGSSYDEAIPSHKTMEATDNNGYRLVSRACHHLLHVYHHLRRNSQSKGVTPSQWINFWSKLAPKYKAPHKRRRDSNAPPKNMCGPTGDISPRPNAWSNDEVKFFESLDITNKSRQQAVYVGAFISCWLCTFVLPRSEERFIRPETFEVSTRMARGSLVSLAIPVLASIYRGLCLLTTSPKPHYSGSVFPAHYVYSWLAYYFQTHHEVKPRPKGPGMVLYAGPQQAKYTKDNDARKLIHEGTSVTLGSVKHPCSARAWLNDDGKLDDDSLSYHISLRTLLLPLRCEGSFTYEAYTPYRFARQFGLCQGVPGSLVLSIDPNNVPFDEAAKLWAIALFSGSKSQAKVLTPVKQIWKDLTTKSFVEWWVKVGVEDLIAKAAVLNDEACMDLPKRVRRSLGKSGETSTNHSETGDMDKSSNDSSYKEAPIDVASSNDDGSDSDFQCDFQRKKQKVVNSPSPTQMKTSDESPLPKQTKICDDSLQSKEMKVGDDFFNDLPSFLDVPSTLALDGDFNYDKEVTLYSTESLLDDVIPNFHEDTDNYDAQVNDENPMTRHPQNDETISEDHVPKMATKVITENQKSLDEPSSSKHSVRISQESDGKPETVGKGVLYNVLKAATSTLLSTIRDNDFSEIEVVANEASQVCHYVSGLNGNPTRLKEKVDSYIDAVTTLHLLESTLCDNPPTEVLNKELVSSKEDLQRTRHLLSSSEEKESKICKAMAIVDDEIIDLEKRYTQACDRKNKLQQDLQDCQANINLVRGQIQEKEAKVVDLEAAPRLREEKIENQRQRVHELRSSFDPHSWMDLVL